ncbi:MAG: toll/interleukin-1 receptor domain-containing protein [Candidatus Caldarchaeum sp.]
MKKVFVILPFSAEFDSVYSVIKASVETLGASVGAVGPTVYRVDEIAKPGNIIEAVFESIETADLIICDISGPNCNVMYELGYAHAIRKPVLVISRPGERIPFDIRSVRALIYDPDNLHTNEFRHRLQKFIAEALEHPELFSNRPRTETEINKVFISYSHKDIEFLQRLLVHLRPLEKEGLIDLWADTKIKAGDKWKAEIENALRHARVAILLISADFLASQFIVENELPPILAKAEMEGTRIIPVIVKPCRFTRDKNLSSFQSINDPSSPLIMLSEGTREQIYDRISEEIEKFMVK